MWLHNDGQAIALGRGGQPSLSHDGKTLAFVASEDEGHVITAADVVVVDLTKQALVGARLESARVERAPAVSDVGADGSVVIAFTVTKTDAPSELVVATLK